MKKHILALFLILSMLLLLCGCSVFSDITANECLQIPPADRIVVYESLNDGSVSTPRHIVDSDTVLKIQKQLDGARIQTTSRPMEGDERLYLEFYSEGVRTASVILTDTIASSAGYGNFTFSNSEDIEGLWDLPYRFTLRNGIYELGCHFPSFGIREAAIYGTYRVGESEITLSVSRNNGQHDPIFTNPGAYEEFEGIRYYTEQDIVSVDPEDGKSFETADNTRMIALIGEHIYTLQITGSDPDRILTPQLLLDILAGCDSGTVKAVSGLQFKCVLTDLVEAPHTTYTVHLGSLPSEYSDADDVEMENDGIRWRVAEPDSDNYQRIVSVETTGGTLSITGVTNTVPLDVKAHLDLQLLQDVAKSLKVTLGNLFFT